MNCRICNKQTNKIFNCLILKKYLVDYYFCESCKFIQTEDPYWLDESYKNPIASIDTGIMKRNLLFTKRSSTLLYFLFDKNRQFLDYGGGYGIFVRMMRDIGFDFYWEDIFAKNIISNGFDFSDDIKNIELITSFECFEHFKNPIEIISQLIKRSDNILFSTQLFQNGPPKPAEWWYYNFEAGQHISLYSKQSLEIIADKFKLNLSSDNKGFHLFSKKKINNSIFNALIKSSQTGLFLMVKILMNSKTDSDMNNLKKRLSVDISNDL